MKERLQTTHVLRVSGRMLVAVQRIRVECHENGAHWWAHAIVEPHALVVVEAGRPRALGPTGAGIPLEPLLRSVDGLAEAIQTIG